MRRPTILFSSLTLTLAAVCASGCAAHKPPAPSAVPGKASAAHPAAPAQTAPRAGSSTSPTSGPAPAAGLGTGAAKSTVPAGTNLPVKPSATPEELVQAARDAYLEGLGAFQKGDMAEARGDFDRAIETLTTAPGGARANPHVSEAYDGLLKDIQEIETTSYQAGSGLSPVEVPPFDVLDQIEPEITPEQAAKERALVESGAVAGDLPVVTNDRVLAWIGTYQDTLHDRFQEGLTRSGKYLDMLHRVFREEGLPEDLVYMAHVESAYKPYAYSRARAKGMWQFIVGTGSRYGLKRDWWIDQRSDPELSARAAAKYLKDLHEMFGDWYLAMAAYNAGEGKIQRAVDRMNTRDFWSIANTSQIRRETKNYVPAILAAVLISKDPTKFGFSKEKEDPLVYDTVEIDSATDLGVAAALIGSTVEDLRILNPSLTRLMTPPNFPNFPLHVPKGKGDEFKAAYAQLEPSDRIPWKMHTVQGGDTLASLSRKYSVSVAQIRQVNSLDSRAGIRAGMVLQIPTYVAAPSGGHGDITRASSLSHSSRGRKRYYTVRKGDTLTGVASHYGVSVASLRSWNHLSSASTIHAGQRLVVYSGRGSDLKGEPPVTRTASMGSGSTGSGRSKSSTGGGTSSQVATYRVRSGDTLFKIASKLSTSVEQICRMNNITASAPLLPGTLLKVER